MTQRLPLHDDARTPTARQRPGALSAAVLLLISACAAVPPQLCAADAPPVAHLAHAHLSQVFHFLQHWLHRATDFLTAGVGHHTEGAVLGAAFLSLIHI